MNSRIVRWLASIAVVVMLVSLLPGTPAARAAGPSPLEEALTGKYKGMTVSVGTTYGGQWYTDYEASFQSFHEKTGIRVAETSADGGSSELDTMVAAGSEPDIVEFGAPGPLLRFVQQGKVVDVTKLLDMDTLRARYDQNWLDWATMAGPNGPIMAGVWTGADVDSLVWYPKAAFDQAGYKVPATWAELLALSDRIVKDGGTPWCIENGFQGQDSSGETATQWVSDLLLRSAPLTDYDRWVRGDLKADSPQVKKAFQLMSDVWFKPGYAYGGRQGLNTTYQWDAVKLLMDTPSKCWLLKEPSWIMDYDGISHSFVWDDKVYGQDYAFFVLPPVDSAYGTPVQVEGMLAAMFHDRPEVRALMEYFTTGAPVHDWITRGLHARLSPHKAANLDWYTNPRDRAVAEVMRNAPATRYWGTDAMPREVDDQYSKSLAAYVAGKVDLDTALKQIDAAWPTVEAAAPPAPAAAKLPVGDLKSVWGASGQDVFAVGDSGAILHYSGKASRQDAGTMWSPMSPGTTDWIQYLNDVWGSSNQDVYAVGSAGTLLHYDGKAWSPVSSGTTTNLTALWGASATDIFAVGFATVLHFDPARDTAQQAAVLGAAGPGGKMWSALDTGPSESEYFLGVWGAENGPGKGTGQGPAPDVYVVGDVGRIRHYDGKIWSSIDCGPLVHLYDIWGTSPDDLFVVGTTYGTIRHYDGKAWSAMSAGTGNDLVSLWGSSGSDVFAVGNNGAIVHYDGKAWSAMASGTTADLNAVWGASADDVFAVGDGGTIVHYDGKAWTVMSGETG